MIETSSGPPGPGLDGGPFDATVFLFGSHTGVFTERSMEKIVRPLMNGPHRSWILATTAGLPSYLEALEERIPAIAQSIAGQKQLGDLDAWLRHGAALWNGDAPLPNIIVSPLLVLTQVAQYWRYLEHQVAQTGEVAVAAVDVQVRTLASSANNKVEALGYCGGLLAALAVASAHDRAEFERYSSVAVRLAMLLGAVADARERMDIARGKGGALSLAMAWTGARQGDELRQIIDSFAGDAYVAVRADAGRATVTASEGTIPALAERLRGAGAIVVETGVRGRIHAPDAEQRAFGEALIEICHAMEGLQYAAPEKLAMPSYSNCESDAGRPIAAGTRSTTETIVRSVMLQQCDWYGTFSAVATANGLKKKLVTFGAERCVPPSMLRQLGRQVVFVDDLDLGVTPLVEEEASLKRHSTTKESRPPRVAHQDQSINPKESPAESESIAVVGMAIKAPNADDLAEFAEMLKTGKSQHELVTPDRLMFDMLFRKPPNPDEDRYYCNFMRDTDAFDHKFFKRSPREAVSMDPQARLSLQCAYQAVEQSGYFSEPQPRDKSARDWKNHIGIYVGCCGSDYEHNAGNHEPNAFTGTGGFRSFVSGRISHYFGWTGPNMLFDTACSSAAVAIHAACRSILTGESSAALAGGANVMTGMQWFQDMAAGSFLSPTGQCKPFDDKADGYCRGEAIGFVYLKKMSDARRDGNLILAEIKSSLVYQNQNTTPLFVPNSPSLSHLFRDVLAKANKTARDVSLVEAHGTGTPVGDPAEYESVRMALGGPSSGRSKKLLLGSVKGHTGHAEGASGIVALIKVIVMMQGNFIPPQASFSKMNHLIDKRPDDMIEVPTTLRPWDDEHKLALINNYGASGSNVSFIVAQGPPAAAPRPKKIIGENDRFPFWISGQDARAISAYSAKLASYCRSLPNDEPSTLSDLSFALAYRSNRALPHAYVFSCRALPELEAALARAASKPDMNAAAAAEIGIKPVKAARPVIMCFGGQVSLSVGLDRNLYDRVAVLRQHLDECDDIVTSLGLASIYPGIFSREPERDTVKLQTMLFAMQYACARAWLDCGLETQVAAVVGHSFGEITALCVSGALSLRDTLSLVAARARLVRDAWGPDSGAMLAVESDEKLVQELLLEANCAPGSDGSASIACYNGPRSFTLAGSTVAVDCVQQALESSAKFSAIKSKRLTVSNAFHSALVDKLVDDLGQVGKSLVFRETVVPIERATQECNGPLDWTFVHSHMRQPVFFNHALQRLVKKYPQAIFLEAGSNSTITVMASRALLQGSSAQAGQDNYHFQAVALTNTDAGFKGLTDVTTDLWKQGVRVTFWAHHREQMPEYAPLLLPPYQFAKGPTSRHWMPMVSPHEAVQKAAKALLEKNGLQLQQQAPAAAHVEKALNLFDFVGWLTDRTNKKRARFRINTESDKYKTLVLSHVVAQTAPVCPDTLVCDVAIQALFSLQPEWKIDEMQPVVRDLVSTTPICAADATTRVLHVEFSALNNKLTQWGAHFFSIDKDAAAVEQQPRTHAEACIDMRPVTEAAHVQEFSRFGRLVSHARCRELLDLSLAEEGVEVLQGRQLYRALAPAVDYADVYRGVRYVVGRSTECAARVKLDRRYRQSGESWLDVPLTESFVQVGGIWLNAMTDRQPEDVYLAAGFEVAMRSPKLRAADRAEAEVWHVYARFTAQDKGNATDYTTDLFIFNADTGALSEVILGVQYKGLAKAAVAEMLIAGGINTNDSLARDSAPAAVVTSASLSRPSNTIANTAHVQPERKSKRVNKQKQQSNKEAVAAAAAAAAAAEVETGTKPGRRDMTEEVRNLVVNISGIEADELGLDTEMADVGIDSLMGMELAREVERAFGCALDHAKQLEATSLRKFVALVENAIFGAETCKLSRASAIKVKVEKGKKATPEAKNTIPTGHRNMTEEVRNLVVSVSGIEADELGLDTEMADVGIDSLMGMELAREVERAFGCTLDHAKQLEATSLRKFVALVENAIFGADVVPRTSAVSDVESLYEDNSLDGSLVVVGEHSSSSTSDDDSDDVQQLTPPSETRATPRTMTTTAQATAAPLATSNLSLSPSVVLDSFAEIKMAADRLLREYEIAGTEKTVMAGNNRLCTVLIVEALDELGCNLRSAKAGQPVERISFVPKQSRLMQWIWEFLERDARLVDIDAAHGNKLTRTHMTVPSKTSDAILDEQLKQYPKFATPSRLAHFAGKKVAGVLSGKTDGLRVLFGSPEGRELMESHECDQPWNRMHYTQIRDVIKGIAERAHLGAQQETLKVLEMGAGVGAITQVLAPFLASLGVPVEFTVTDPSSTLVAGSRRRWGEQYPFMRFAVHDLEKAPTAKLQDQHILVGSAVHATRSLLDTLVHMRRALRPDGALLMLEMTEGVPFANLVFGSLERWWLFDDGRTAALVPAEHWERKLHAAGFGHVDWTDGDLPEHAYHKVIVALASGAQGPRLPKPAPAAAFSIHKGDVTARTATAEALVAKYSAAWATPALEAKHAKLEKVGNNNSSSSLAPKLGHVVLVTGGTGSLGCHIMQSLAESPTVAQVVCLNRPSVVAADKRQHDALRMRGIALKPGARAKVRALATDMAQPTLGLPPHEYAWLSQHATHIVHNAWPMSGTRPLTAFTSSLQAMRNLLDLARDVAVRNEHRRLTFLFVSSIGAVGCSTGPRVLEERLPLAVALPNGYGEAKWVCERVLDATLHRFPLLFRASVVRPGQIAGSSTSGFWNPDEHFAFMVKSSQSLRVWPDLGGTLLWTPVDHCGGVVADLALNPAAEGPVYHMDNPVGQPWRDMNPVLARLLDVPAGAILPFRDWIKRVRTSPLVPETENPAARNGMADFLAENFERMSCGGLVLDTQRAREHSVTMAAEGPVSEEVVGRYVEAWKKMGFLN